MGVELPDTFKTKIIGPIGPVTIDGIPDHFHITVEDPLPKIQIGVDPITLKPVEATLTLKPLDVTIRIDRIPDIRAHLPADFSVGMSVLGMELMSIRLCGEAQMITEPYVAGPCEQVGDPETGPKLAPLPERKG